MFKDNGWKSQSPWFETLRIYFFFLFSSKIPLLWNLRINFALVKVILNFRFCSFLSNKYLLTKIFYNFLFFLFKTGLDFKILSLYSKLVNIYYLFFIHFGACSVTGFFHIFEYSEISFFKTESIFNARFIFFQFWATKRYWKCTEILKMCFSNIIFYFWIFTTCVTSALSLFFYSRSKRSI